MDKIITDINVYILTGGKSRRFTTDKCLAILNGETLTELIYKKLSVLFSNVIIIGKKNHFPKLNFVKDVNPIQCPLNGIAAALEHTNSEWNFVIACDMPIVKIRTISNIIDNTKVKYQVIAPLIDDQIQPLCALYNKNVLPIINMAIDKGDYSLKKLFEQLDIAKIALPKNYNKQFLNINYPEDLEKAEKLIRL